MLEEIFEKFSLLQTSVHARTMGKTTYVCSACESEEMLSAVLESISMRKAGAVTNQDVLMVSSSSRSSTHVFARFGYWYICAKLDCPKKHGFVIIFKSAVSLLAAIIHNYLRK